MDRPNQFKFLIESSLRIGLNCFKLIVDYLVVMGKQLMDVGFIRQMLSLATSTIKLAATFLTNQQQQQHQQQQQQQQQQPQKHQLDGDLVQYSLAQVALHSSSHDCWIIIRDKVYDVTSYVSQVRFFRDSSIRC